VSRLDPALGELLEEERLAVARATEITALPGTDAPRRTYRIDLEDGRRLKGRIVSGPDRAERMRRWLPALPKGRFPVLLAAAGSATLESWIPGFSCRESDEAAAETAGALLSLVHQSLVPERLSESEPRFAAWCADAERWLSELRTAGHLDDALARRVGDHLEGLRPMSATWGLRHGDLCAENLVHGAAGLCCIDNVTVAPGLIESDLAQTFYRWPMTPSQRERFLRGYGRGEAAVSFLRHEDFWIITAALRAGAFRLRHRAPAIGVPLDVLSQRVA
jgi:hypothetical protein